MEKKPLPLALPARILSLGTVGQYDLLLPELAPLQRDEKLGLIPIAPEELVWPGEKYKSNAVAFTYNEPFVWYEFVIASGKLLKQENIAVVLVTNG